MKLRELMNLFKDSSVSFEKPNGEPYISGVIDSDDVEVNKVEIKTLLSKLANSNGDFERYFILVVS